MTRAHFTDFSDTNLEANERSEDLFQRLMAFAEDSLLRTNGLNHNGETITEDEVLTSTLDNLMVLTWLKLIHPSLSRLVKQYYGTELRSRTLASIKLEISQAISSLLDKIGAFDDAKILHTAVSTEYRGHANKGIYKATPRQPRQDKVFPLCKQASRTRSETCHLLSKCEYFRIATDSISSKQGR